jgi:hypothetical protein
MRLREAYRIALMRGLTAKQAGAEFGLKASSISGIKTRYNFPSLMSEFEYQDRLGYSKMTNDEIHSYMSCLEIEGKTDSKEYRYCQDELKKR